MGIYFGCHCFSMTNGHASSCVAQFIYADIIRPLKWNIQWAICQKFKAYLTWSLLQCYSFYVLNRLKAKYKLDEYPWLGEILTWFRKEVTWYSEWNTSSSISLAFFMASSRRDLKVRKQFFFSVSVIRKRSSFPKVSCSEGHWDSREKLWLFFLRGLGEQHTCSFSGPCQDTRVLSLPLCIYSVVLMYVCVGGG